VGSTHLSTNFEVIALSVMAAVIIFDLLLVVKRPHVPSFKEALGWVVFYVSLALCFGLVLAYVANWQLATEFYAGWITEYSLSVDNLFIFVLIIASFRVPKENQQMVLMIGIVIALILRATLIVLGAAAIEHFSWVFYIFGAFLIYTAVKLVTGGGEDEEYKENAVIARLRRVLPIHDEYLGNKLTLRVDGRKMFTPMLIVIVALGSTDLLFALDSIPAIFGLTKDPFVVFSTNLFALMGLRQLYFLLGGLLDRLVYLSYGLSFILGFIGIKLVLHALHENTLPFLNGGQSIGVPEVPTWVSLVVIAVTLVLTATLSLTIGVKRTQSGKPAKSNHTAVAPTEDPEIMAKIDELTHIDPTKESLAEKPGKHE